MLKSQCRFVISFVWIFFLDKNEGLGRWKHLWKLMTVFAAAGVRVLDKVFSGTGVSILHQEQPSQEAFLLSPECRRKEYAIILQMKSAITWRTWNSHMLTTFYPQCWHLSVPSFHPKTKRITGDQKEKQLLGRKSADRRTLGIFSLSSNSHIDNIY